MALFDDEKVFVDVLATKLTDNEVTPLKNAVISNTVRDAGVSDGILAGMLNGLGARAHRYHKYAEKGKWSLGLPEVNIGLVTRYDVYDATPYPQAFYPIVNFRKNGVFLTKESDEPLHKETKRLLKRVAINLDDIVANIEDDQREDENGDVIPGNPVSDIDDSFFLFGLDLYSLEEKSAEYCYDFWENTSSEVKQSKAMHEQALIDFETGGISGQLVEIPTNVIEFKDGTGEYEIRYLFDYIEHTEVIGTLLNDEGKVIDAKVTMEKNGIHPYTWDEGGSPIIWYIDEGRISYHKQIANNVIGIWHVSGIVHETIVHAYEEKNSVVKCINDVPNKGAGTYDTFFGLVPGDVDFGRSGMYLPLCFEVLELQNPIQEEKVLSDAMVIIMHAAQEVDLKWYQQGWFKVVMVIIVAVITYFSLGRLLKEGITLIASLTELAVQFGLAFLANLLVKEVGGELGMVLAIAVAAYAASRGDFTEAQNLMPAAKELLIATHAITSVSNAKIKNDMSALQEEMHEFDASLKERKAALHEVALMLGDPAAEINALDIIYENNNNMGDNETATEWMDRMKTTNVASLVKEQISLYHSRMKELPQGMYDNSPTYV